MSKRDLATLDRDICQPLGRILQEIGEDGWANSEHLKLETSDDEKNVRINSRDYTTDCSSSGAGKTFIAVQAKPNVTVGGAFSASEGACVVGFEASPRFDEGIVGLDLTGIISNPLLKGKAGDLKGEMRAYEGKVECPSGSTRTVTGPVSILKAGQAMHGTVTNGVFVIDVDTAGGNVAWDGLLNLPDDNAIASDTALTWGSTGDAAGWIKVDVEGTKYIQLYSSG